jgi:hypothetical protein
MHGVGGVGCLDGCGPLRSGAGLAMGSALRFFTTHDASVREDTHDDISMEPTMHGRLAAAMTAAVTRRSSAPDGSDGDNEVLAQASRCLVLMYKVAICHPSIQCYAISGTLSSIPLSPILRRPQSLSSHFSSHHTRPPCGAGTTYV